MTKRCLAVLLVWVVLAMEWLPAGIIPGRWEKVDRLGAGTTVVVRLKAGDRLEGVFKSSDPQELAVETTSTGVRRVSKTSVEQVLLPDVKSKTPYRLGAALGAGAGAAAGAAVAQSFDETIMARTEFQALIFGCIGALAGALIGNAVASRQDVVIYQAAH